MADSSNIDEDNNLEDNLSSEDWTIIYKKEPENNHSSKEQVKNNESLNSDTDSEITTEDICICALFDGKCNSKIEDIEIGEEVVEKETESDISIISEESESEQLNYNGTLESSNSQIVTKHQLEAEILSSNPASDGNLTSNALIIYSVIAMIFGIIIAGQIVEFRGDNSAYSVNNDIQEKLRELIGLKKKLNDLNDVKETLNQIRLSMPEMKKFKDQLSYKKHKRNKEKYFMNNDKYFENINDEYISNLNDYDDKLGMLEATYQNFCSVISKINSTDVELCKTPKILLNLINFKKNLKEVIKKTVEIGSQEKRLFVDIERRLDFISESLLFELKTLFFKFTLKIQERLNKMEYEMLNRFYYLYINENINHEFLNVFLDKSYFLNSCNGSNADPLMINLKWNVTQADKKRFKDKKKKSHEEMNKKAYKFNYKNYKGYKKPYDSKENHFYEKMYTQENFNKGEANNESWKRNKYENKEKYFEEEKKYNKHERSNNYKNDLNKKNKPIYSDDISLENNKKKSDFNKKVDNKSNHNYDCKFDNDKEERECKKKFHGKTNKEFDRKLKYNKENEVSNEADHKKKYNSREKNFEDEKNYDFTENDLKYVVNLENYSDKYNRYSEEKGRYKDDEEFILKIENFRDSKFVKYDDRSDKRKKYQPNGDWQINRGKAREKQRNSDWYFVRADSRQKARVVEVDEEETLNFSSSRKKYRGKELINSLEKQKSRHTSELKALSDKVLRSKEEWDEIQENFQNQIAETMKNSKANIAKCTAHYSKKINYHQQTLDNFKALVESEKKSNRRVENELQGKKFKVESQLLSLIMKFDAEVIEKQEIYDELMAEYEVVQEEKSILTDEMDEQLLIYESIMADKQEKEQAIFNEKFNKFIRNRCAKVIQRWWRRIIEKINAAKKKKKRKGKK